MKKQENIPKITVGILFIIFALGFVSTIIVDSDYITLYPGESEEITLEIENNENWDIEDVSLALNLSNLPFTTIGSS